MAAYVLFGFSITTTLKNDCSVSIAKFTGTSLTVVFIPPSGWEKVNWTVSESFCLPTMAENTVAGEPASKLCPGAGSTSTIRPCSVNKSSTVSMRVYSPFPLKVYLRPSSVIM